MNDAEQVRAYMQQLDHPLKEEAEMLRSIIKNAHPDLSERIKWNAPSYFTHVDLLTFNFHDKKSIRLVFHHPAIVHIRSEMLKGDYKDRRLAFFDTKAAVEAGAAELKKIIRELVVLTEQ